MPLEMRIMGGSDMIMAPQRGNTLETCAIEILTLYSAKDIWPSYARKVLDTWKSYKDKDGKKLRIRPHWAKQWQEFEVDGRPGSNFSRRIFTRPRLLNLGMPSRRLGVSTPGRFRISKICSRMTFWTVSTSKISSAKL
jgi:hypothetical protein